MEPGPFQIPSLERSRVEPGTGLKDRPMLPVHDRPMTWPILPSRPGPQAMACPLWIDSNFSFPRLTAARTRLGSAVHTKGLGSELVSARKRVMAALRSATDRNTPRRRRRRVSLAKKPSTALSQDAEVGVKWNVQRGCWAAE